LAHSSPDTRRGSDFKGNKKKLLFAFILIGALSTAVLAFVSTWHGCSSLL
jgi:MFS-type transporter involved in bile tolerance (Atg22 family)